jgi:hypothetical protein
MQVDSAPDGPPVYVLGAGFSRAISAAMPLTDELGDAVTKRLRFSWPEGTENVSFEERLTLLSTALPFLPSHRNTARRAQAEELTAALGQVLNERNSEVAHGAAPLWLLQLVSLWHAQHAKVITFNYDTLVERAVTARRPPLLLQRDYIPHGVHGWQVAYPSPAPVNIYSSGDAEGPTLGAFQLLKLHGSLNWYWAAGDPSTLVRDASMQGFWDDLAEGKDTAGVRLLDRFLVPPVTSKDSYYGINLVHLLWRAAYEAIASAPSLSILGYSMPPADRIAAELLRAVRRGSPVDLVNRDLGSETDAASPLRRARGLGFGTGGRWDGDQAVERFVADALHDASAVLGSSTALTGKPGAAVVVGFRFGAEPRTAVLRDSEQGVVATGIDWYGAGVSDMPPHEYALNQGLPRGVAKLADFYTAERLTKAVASGAPFDFNIDAKTYRAVGAETTSLGRWPIVHLLAAPTN